MKIVYLSSPISSQFGGGEKFLDDFTNGIEAEHEFVGSSKAVYDLFVSKGYKATLTSGLFEPVSVRNLILLPVSILVGLFQLMRFYQTFMSADWIVSPTSHCETFFVIPWIKLFLRKPVLFMVHSKPPKVFGIFPFNYLVSRFWGSSPVTFVSNSQKDLWNQSGCKSANQIVIYNGVKTNDLNIKTRDQDSKIKIGFIARLHREKGCDVFINALEYIKSDQEIEIIIAGEGEEKHSLIALYELKKQQKLISDSINIQFVGFQSDAKFFYESIDILVFPSRSEGFSLVLLEAWERGLPVITSNIPPFLEAKFFMNDNEQNLVFKLDNSLDLASKIDYFITNKSVYLDFSYTKKLHLEIINNFGCTLMIQKYQKILFISD